MTNRFAATTINERDDGFFEASSKNAENGSYRVVVAADPISALRAMMNKHPYTIAERGLYSVVSVGTHIELHVNGMKLSRGNYDQIIAMFKAVAK